MYIKSLGDPTNFNQALEQLTEFKLMAKTQALKGRQEKDGLNITPQ